MKKFVLEWQQFMKEWGTNPQNWIKKNKNQIFKPQFYDFMDWLSKQNNKENVVKVIPTKEPTDTFNMDLTYQNKLKENE